jgi:hypothetical protein
VPDLVAQEEPGTLPIAVILMPACGLPALSRTVPSRIPVVICPNAIGGLNEMSRDAKTPAASQGRQRLRANRITELRGLAVQIA